MKGKKVMKKETPKKAESKKKISINISICSPKPLEKYKIPNE